MTKLYYQILCYTESLRQRINALEAHMNAAPDGQLCIRKRRSRTYFSIRTSSKDPEIYLSCRDSDMIEAYAQKRYASTVLPKLRANLRAAESFLRQYSGSDEGELASAQSSILLQLIRDTYVTRDSCAEAWLRQTWPERAYEDDPPQLPTLRGDLVRSKSEAAIANSLFSRGIPYLYEKPLYLPDSEYPVFPDFTILDTYTRTEKIWDHLGLMDDPFYASKNTRKIRRYEKAGYIPGKNLILTFETKDCPFTATNAEQTIKALLLDDPTGLFVP